MATSNTATVNYGSSTVSEVSSKPNHSTYRNTIAEYCNSSYWQQQPHPVYCSWRQTPSPHNSSHLSQSSPANTLPSKHSNLKDSDIVEGSGVVFRNVSGALKRPPTVSRTTDSQSICRYFKIKNLYINVK